MDTEIDWQSELDRSFGRARTWPSGRYVASGRRAVRRRRAPLAAVAGIGRGRGGGGAWGWAGQCPPARSCRSRRTRTARPGAEASELRAEGDPPARFAGDGTDGIDELEIREGSALPTGRRPRQQPGQAHRRRAGARTSASAAEPRAGLEPDGTRRPRARRIAHRRCSRAREDLRVDPPASRDDSMIVDVRHRDRRLRAAWSAGRRRGPAPRTASCVTRVVADPVTPPTTPSGLVLRKGDEVTSMLITRTPPASSSSRLAGADSVGTFGEWLRRPGDVPTATGAAAGAAARGRRVPPALPGVGCSTSRSTRTSGPTAPARPASGRPSPSWSGRTSAGSCSSSTTRSRPSRPTRPTGPARLDAFVAFMADVPTRAACDEATTEFTDFVAARQAHLRRIAYALCGDWHRADDLLQTALTKLYVAWPRIRNRGGEEAYVRQIMVRANIDESRRPWRRDDPSDQLPDLPGAEPTASRSGPRSSTPAVAARAAAQGGRAASLAGAVRARDRRRARASPRAPSRATAAAAW